MWRLLIIAAIIQFANSDGECKLPVNLGKQNCGKPPQTLYFFDVDTYMCLAFNYSGCGGNHNSFNTSEECEMWCSVGDERYHACDNDTPKVGFCSRSKKCPKGSSCKMIGSEGVCCLNEDDKRLVADENPNCGNKKVVKERIGRYKRTLFGKSCSHNFCPKNSECRRGNFFSYCCK
ncbi:unnamed protein product [Cylicocyclus nassatus]|uniref:BPTI/Kunitz inhibitor domain-containing protein n=1 Tax=Cylicocyclus nassatus TaxID=53992 RepID=A0AA36DQV0_CYLNA|nr:unnamed protein product [Cylicocyclus nassatus]